MEAEQLKQELQAIISHLDRGLILAALADRFDRIAPMFAQEVPADAAADSLYEFLLNYVSDTSELGQILGTLAAQYKMEPLISPYIVLSTNYLTSACHELVNDRQAGSVSRLMSLLHGAYIFHRMIEELDDRIQNFIGVPLTHCNTLNSNLIAHDIIGDRFANRLDQVVDSLFQQSKITKAVIEAQLDRSQIALFRNSGRALSGEPVRCLAAKYNLGISLA